MVRLKLAAMTSSTIDIIFEAANLAHCKQNPGPFAVEITVLWYGGVADVLLGCLFYGIFYVNSNGLIGALRFVTIL